MNTQPVGYAALIDRYGLRLPLPRPLMAVRSARNVVQSDGWVTLDPRRHPGDTLSDHVLFALKHEGVRLDVLRQLFEVVRPEDLAEIPLSMPTSRHARRLWFLFEWMTGGRLDIPDAPKVAAVPVLDIRIQFGIEGGEVSTRHRVRNNLPGTPAFCPLVYRTEAIGGYIDEDLADRARREIGRVHPDVVARAAAFLLLGDSRASYQIEGENPSPDRAQRWARAIGEAGSVELSVDELERLQRIVIGDHRFVKLGLRDEGGFIGQHDRVTGEPIPDHISARPNDLRELLTGMIAYVERSIEGGLDPVVAAASVAFGFVFVHPFEDGNGRIHRWLIHHLLSRSGYSPLSLVFPISSAILNRLDEYRSVLESRSQPLLPFISWRSTPTNNVEVTTETADYYRYFDASDFALFLFKCVEQTVKYDLPTETGLLEHYDRFSSGLRGLVEMPDRMVSLLYRFLNQNDGKLSNRAREREFSQLTETEARAIEQLFADG